MTNEQLSFLDELTNMLTNVLLDKSDSYEIITNDENGNSKQLINREEYLERVISTTIVDLGSMFPDIS